MIPFILSQPSWRRLPNGEKIWIFFVRILTILPWSVNNVFSPVSSRFEKQIPPVNRFAEYRPLDLIERVTSLEYFLPREGRISPQGCFLFLFKQKFVSAVDKKVHQITNLSDVSKWHELQKIYRLISSVWKQFSLYTRSWLLVKLNVSSVENF